MRLRHRVAVITGAGSGIGRAIALRFAAEGAKIVAAGQTLAKLEETVRRIAEAGGEATAIRCDISNLEQVKDLMRATVEGYGRLDILVNNAAINNPSTPVSERVHDMPEDWWAASLAVNLTGYFYCSKYALAEMLRAGSGAILNIGSSASLAGFANHSPYAASKHGVIGLTKSMALDYARHGIRVNALCPGFVDTERVDQFEAIRHDPGWKQRAGADNPLGRIGRPEEIAAAALFLVSDEASYITGVVLAADGGTAARR